MPFKKEVSNKGCKSCSDYLKTNSIVLFGFTSSIFSFPLPHFCSQWSPLSVLHLIKSFPTSSQYSIIFLFLLSSEYLWVHLLNSVDGSIGSNSFTKSDINPFPQAQQLSSGKS